MATAAIAPAPPGTPGVSRARDIRKPVSAHIDAVLVEDIADRRSARSMREIIAVWLVGLLCAVVALAFVALFLDPEGDALDKRFQHLKALLDVVLGPVVTLVSSAIGFYFGTQVAQPKGSGSGAKADDNT